MHETQVNKRTISGNPFAGSNMHTRQKIRDGKSQVRVHNRSAAVLL